MMTTYEDLIREHEEHLARELGYDEVTTYDDLIEMQDRAIEELCS